MSSVSIRPFQAADSQAVQSLFVEVNRLLAPPHLKKAFDAYVESCMAEEISRIADYYGERGGGFWVATRDNGCRIVGMFGLESTSLEAMELRRMYVDPTARRSGIASAMLTFAEDECRRRGVTRVALSTSELQEAALGLYRSAGYRETSVVVAEKSSNRTIGAGIRRFEFEKDLSRSL